MEESVEVGNVGALIVDDNEDMRHLVRLLVELTGDLKVVGEAAEGNAAVECWRELRPDVIVLDYRLPGPNGLDVAAQILKEDPSQPVILFSAFLDEATIDEAEHLGVCHCLAKNEVRLIPDLVRQYGAHR